MLPSLSQLPIGAPGTSGVLNGRVLNARGDPQHVMDEAERWRRKQLERMERRRASGVDRVPGSRTTHRTDPIPPVAWEEVVEVLADGALVNVLASTLDVPEEKVAVKNVRSAVLRATGQSSAELARVVAEISNTDGGTKLGWWAFGRRLLRAVPCCVSKRTPVSASIQALDWRYLAKPSSGSRGKTATPM